MTFLFISSHSPHPKDNPQRIAVIDAKKGAEEVFEDIIQILKERQIIG